LATQGEALAAASDTKKGTFAGQFLAAEKDWYSHVCGGFNVDSDDSAWWKSFAVGDVLSYTSGFRFTTKDTKATIWKSGSSTAQAADFTYTVLDSAVALTLGAAAVSSVTANFF